HRDRQLEHSDHHYVQYLDVDWGITRIYRWGRQSYYRGDSRFEHIELGQRQGGDRNLSPTPDERICSHGICHYSAVGDGYRSLLCPAEFFGPHSADESAAL